MRHNKYTRFYKGNSGLDWTKIFKNFAGQDWIRINFFGTGWDSDWKVSQSTYLWWPPEINMDLDLNSAGFQLCYAVGFYQFCLAGVKRNFWPLRNFWLVVVFQLLYFSA